MIRFYEDVELTIDYFSYSKGKYIYEYTKNEIFKANELVKANISDYGRNCELIDLEFDNGGWVKMIEKSLFEEL